jgi:hypothetical protein
MIIFVYEDQEARFLLALSNAMDIPVILIGSLGNQSMIDNTGAYCKGMTKRFFHRKETINVILLAMTGMV